MPLPPVATLDLFPEERMALLGLLDGLRDEEWLLPTACPGWTVKDVSLHLLGDDAGRLAAGRDGWRNPGFADGLDGSTLPGLIAAIDRQNAAWVTGTRRLSPRLLIDLLRLTGAQTQEYFATLDLAVVGGPVDWAGPEPAPVWLDLAREYTERWVHQQHIRDAVGRPGLKERRWFRPVLDTFVHGLRRPLSGIAAPVGATLRLTIAGDAGGTWSAVRTPAAWELHEGGGGTTEAAVEIGQEAAWRLFTKGLDPATAARDALIAGDRRLVDAVFATVSVLA